MEPAPVVSVNHGDSVSADFQVRESPVQFHAGAHVLIVVHVAQHGMDGDGWRRKYLDEFQQHGLGANVAAVQHNFHAAGLECLGGCAGAPDLAVCVRQNANFHGNIFPPGFVPLVYSKERVNAMKQRLFMAVAMLVAGLAQAEVRVGDSLAAVRAELGEPRGEMSSGDYHLLYYERGKVELRGGKVVKADLISAEELERRTLLGLQRAAEAEKAAQEARARRITEGTALRQAKLADAVFMRSSADDRVAFWQYFKKTYPEVALGDEYTMALRELEQDLAEARVEQQRQAQIAALEQRVSDAEDRARRAERRNSFVYETYAPPIYAWMPDCNHGAPVRFTPHTTPLHSRIGPASGTTTYGPYLRSAMALPGLNATYSSDGRFNISFGTRP